MLICPQKIEIKNTIKVRTKYIHKLFYSRISQNTKKTLKKQYN